MIHELNHVGIRIADLDASLAFYTGALGAQVVSQVFIASSRTDCVYLQIADGLIELLRPADPPPGTTFGLDHIAFMTDDLDAEHRRLVAAGFTFSVVPRVAGSGRGRLAFLTDPNGVRVELLQREEDFRVAPLTGGLACSLDHYGVAADDLAAAEAFYGGHLGMRWLATLADGAGATLAYFHLGGDAVELYHPPDVGTAGTAAGTGARTDLPRLRHVALRVHDVDEAVDQLRAAGVPVEASAPAGTGLGRQAVVRDPDGVVVLLVDRADPRELVADR